MNSPKILKSDRGIEIKRHLCNVCRRELITPITERGYRTCVLCEMFGSAVKKGRARIRCHGGRYHTSKLKASNCVHCANMRFMVVKKLMGT